MKVIINREPEAACSCEHSLVYGMELSGIKTVEDLSFIVDLCRTLRSEITGEPIKTEVFIDKLFDGVPFPDWGKLSCQELAERIKGALELVSSSR